jgi:hypothetical protein
MRHKTHTGGKVLVGTRRIPGPRLFSVSPSNSHQAQSNQVRVNQAYATILKVFEDVLNIFEGVLKVFCKSEVSLLQGDAYF